MSKNNEIQRKSGHKIAFPQNDKNALTTFLHSTDDMSHIGKSIFRFKLYLSSY